MSEFHGIHVKSEIGKLRKVILHRPGRELLNLTPDTLEELLFDDIPYLRVAQEEHDAFAGGMRERGVEVAYLEDLMADVIGSDKALRVRFLNQWLEEADIHTDLWKGLIIEYLAEMYPDPKELVLKTMEGINLAEIGIARSNMLVDMVASPSEMLVNPMPNLYFTRDPFANVGEGVMIHRMYSVTRNRETIYGEYIYANHPDFKAVPHYYSRRDPFHIEGGDVLNISATTLAVGISQRTEPDAIDQLARKIFDDDTSTIDTILAFDIPNTRAFMHLDTVFTQIDQDKFTVHPGILGPLTVYALTKDGYDVKVERIDSDLAHILEKYVGNPVELIQCAGGDRIAAEREQWNDGSNTLALAPGSVVVYQRNEVTNEILDQKGVDLMIIPSGELSRGRGGPRCMSMPVWRDDL
jgi:arginine deiminase